MPITLNGTTGITTDGGYTGDGVSFADNTPANTLVTTTGGNVGIGTSSPNIGGVSRAITVNGSGGTILELATNGARQGWLYADSNLTAISSSGSQYLSFQTNGGTERGRFQSNGDFQFNSGYGSVATAYGCRAWVNFNGTGTVAIRASGNVSSITDNGNGDYTINMTNAMPDANYAVHFSGNGPTINDYNNQQQVPYAATPTTSSVRIFFKDNNAAGATGRDCLFGFVTIFR